MRNLLDLVLIIKFFSLLVLSIPNLHISKTYDICVDTIASVKYAVLLFLQATHVLIEGVVGLDLRSKHGDNLVFLREAGVGILKVVCVPV